jgi:hypothetical protein
MPIPALHPMKPGSAGPGVPGIHPIIYDEASQVIAQLLTRIEGYQPQ